MCWPSACVHEKFAMVSLYNYCCSCSFLGRKKISGGNTHVFISSGFEPTFNSGRFWQRFAVFSKPLVPDSKVSGLDQVLSTVKISLHYLSHYINKIKYISLEFVQFSEKAAPVKLSKVLRNAEGKTESNVSDTMLG